jgi:hypothetical protein
MVGLQLESIGGSDIIKGTRVATTRRQTGPKTGHFGHCRSCGQAWRCALTSAVSSSARNFYLHIRQKAPQLPQSLQKAAVLRFWHSGCIIVAA